MKQAVLAGPLVSVIIPTHNRIDALKRAITSLSKQNYSNLEVIVVDDGSDVPVGSVYTDVEVRANLGEVSG